MSEQRLLFGRDRDPGVQEEFIGARGAARTKGGSLRTNPLLALGPGPEGAICGTCVHLYRVGGVAGRYYKCALRKATRSASTDHRVRWPACVRYEPEAQP